jgi:ACT domain-containing protein
MSQDELLRRVIAQVLSEVEVERAPAASLASTVTARGAVLPVLPAGTEPPIDYCALCVEQEARRGRKRAVLTTTGKNKKGIVARMTQVIADAGGDILDISQTLVSDYFTMIIVVDIGGLDATFEEFKGRITAASGELGVQTMMMHEDVMAALHRV